MYRGQSGFWVVGLFGNIRSMTPLLVVSASQEFSAENMAYDVSSQLFISVETFSFFNSTLFNQLDHRETPILSSNFPHPLLFSS